MTTKTKSKTNLETKANSLAERAMLVKLTATRWHPRKTDSRVNQEVAANHNLKDATMGNYRKQLLDKALFKELDQIDSEARQFHYKHTLPYTEGWGLITGAEFQNKYKPGIQELMKRRDKALSVVPVKFPEYKAQAKQDLGTLYREEDYPTLDEIMDQFKMEIEIQALPSKDHFHVQMVDEEVTRILDDIEAKRESRVAEAMKDPYRRVAEVLQKAVDRLSIYTKDEDNGVKNPFRDSLMTNIRDLVDLIPAINVTGDANLSALAEKIKAEVLVDPENLRNDEELRKHTVATADQILADISEFI